MQADDDESVRQVLAQYAPRVKPLRVEPLGNRGGFSGAAIWRVVTVAGDFALRRWPRCALPRHFPNTKSETNSKFQSQIFRTAAR